MLTQTRKRLSTKVYPVKYMGGIGMAYAIRLEAAGIQSTEDLLRLCGTRDGREQVSWTTGIHEEVLLTWSHRADLMRVKGVGTQYAELLEAAGVETIDDLASRDPDELSRLLMEINAEWRLADLPPSPGTVQAWIVRAGNMKPAVNS